LKSDVRILKGHPRNTIGLLGNFEISPAVKKAIIHHHERFDGTGYPDQLKGEDIPFLSRVLSVVDAFCAMTSDRPYRKAFAREEALKEIQKGAGSVYDPTVVEAIQEVLAVK
jgi:HD-GYP domain-containing protein (c-di-GMP phosphodiesterase class II)